MSFRSFFFYKGFELFVGGGGIFRKDSRKCGTSNVREGVAVDFLAEF